MTVTEATAWGAESDKNRSQASYCNLVTDTRIAPKEAWSYLNPARGSSRWLAVAVGAVVGDKLDPTDTGVMRLQFRQIR